MEVVCQSDYQDIYRIKYGVLLIVDKFEYIYRNDGTHDYIASYCKAKRYTNTCQKELKILTTDYHSAYSDKIYKAGQVIYNGYPVELCDISKWSFQIKTTGDEFSGNNIDMIMLLNSIANIIVQYNDEAIKEIMNENVY